MTRKDHEIERLSISLPREDAQTLRELASLTGRPISHIIGQFCRPELDIARQILSLGRAHDPLLWDTMRRLMAEPPVVGGAPAPTESDQPPVGEPGERAGN